MSYRGNQKANPRYMIDPACLVFRFFQSQTTCVIWLQENKKMRLEGRIASYDEFLNIVLDDAKEFLVNKEPPHERKLGRIFLKGDNVALIHMKNGGGSSASLASQN